MGWLNTNSIHNILNLAITVIAALMAFDWGALGVDPTLGGKIIAALGALKLLINAVRDGMAGMIKPQPPVISN